LNQESQDEASLRQQKDEEKETEEEDNAIEEGGDFVTVE
jgi:hypothetical protein